MNQFILLLNGFSVGLAAVYLLVLLTRFFPQLESALGIVGLLIGATGIFLITSKSAHLKLWGLLCLSTMAIALCVGFYDSASR